MERSWAEICVNEMEEGRIQREELLWHRGQLGKQVNPTETVTYKLSLRIISPVFEPQHELGHHI